VIENAAPQRFRADASGITLDMARGALADATSAPIEGVLLVAEGLDGGGARHAFAVRAEPRPAEGGPAAASAALSVAGAMALALAGGVILNLMPCVLPVLSVKALGLIRHGSEGAWVLRRHGLAYTAGVLAAFAAVAGALLALRAAGEQLGWGFQLQSPPFVVLLAFVLFVMALALSGVVVIGGRLTGVGHALTERPGYAGSFFAGALAAVAATPCTAPFMGTAIGFAVTQPWTTALLVFEALAFGLALPYLLLTLVPAWRRLLPRPGPWMRRFEQALAVPLYGSVAWLVWVVSQQAGAPGVAAALAGLVLIGFAAWLFQESRGAGAPGRRVATTAAAALAAVAVALAPLASGPWGSRSAPEARADARWEPFSDARLAELRASRTPVFVNVTAAWCITCLVNERVALRAPAVVDAFARRGVVMLKADWTTRDPGITRVLESFGRSGVPLYLYYPPPAADSPGPVPATVLPQILTEGTVIQAIEAI
jgi:thiol:disulfide interchange protein DsbD